MKPGIVGTAYAVFFLVVAPVGGGALVAHAAGGPLGLLVWAVAVLMCALAGWAYGRTA